MLRPTVPAALTERPFTVAEAAEHGISATMLESAVWRRVIRGVHVHAGVPDSRWLRARAASLLLEPGVFLCGISAAWLYGVDLHPMREPLPSLWVGCRNGRRVRPRAGWKVREITVSSEEIFTVEGVSLTSPVRTAFDCARWCRLFDAVVVLDDLAHRGLVTLDAVRHYAEAQYRIRGKRGVARIVDLTDPRAESPQETRLRLTLTFDGLHAQPQFELYDGRTFIARLDLAFVTERVAVEYEGRQHAETAAQDEWRRAAIRAMGWEVIRVYAEDLATEPARRALIARIRRELLARRAPASR